MWVACNFHIEYKKISEVSILCKFFLPVYFAKWSYLLIAKEVYFA